MESNLFVFVSLILSTLGFNMFFFFPRGGGIFAPCHLDVHHVEVYDWKIPKGP